MQTVHKLKRNLLRFYIILGSTAYIIFFLKSMIMYKDLAYTLRYHAPIIVLEVFIGVLFWYVYSMLYLKPLFDYCEDKNNSNKLEVFQKTIEFPYRFLIISIKVCTGIAIGKLVYDILFIFDLSINTALLLIYKLISNIGIIIILNMVIYVSLRKMIKPVVEDLQEVELGSSVKIPTKQKILICGIAVYLEIFDPFNMSIMGIATMILFLIMGIVFVKFILFDQAEAIIEITTELKKMLGKKRDKIHNILPVTSWDEVGELTSAYNGVQRKIQGLYQELDEELKLAHQVQQQLLPEIMLRETWYEIEALSIPARETGGDFFDFYNLDENRVGIVIGDVSGKGVPAALIMSAVMGLIRGKIRGAIETPLELISYLNQALVPILNDEMFVTVGFGIIDRKKNTFSYVSAGHLPPLLTTKERAYLLEGSSFPIGFNEESKFKIHTVHLEEITSIIMYSDGIIERQDRSGIFFGYDNFITSLSEVQSLSQLLNKVEEFSEGSDSTDDMTIMKLSLNDRR